MSEVLRTSKYLFSVNTRTVKYLTSFLLITYAIYTSVSPVELASETLNLNINFGIIAVVCSDPVVLIFLSLAALFVFSNLPEDRPAPYFVISRSGKVKWVLSNFLYIVVISTLMLMLVLIEIILFSKGRLFPDNNWGKIITGITTGQIYESFGITLEAGMPTLKELLPLDAVIWSISSLEMTFIISGCISFVLNTLIKRGTGTVFNGVIIFMHMLCRFFPTYLRYYFSPIDWCSIFVVDTTGYGGVPGPAYIWSVRGTTVTLLIIAAVVAAFKMKGFCEAIEGKQI